MGLTDKQLEDRQEWIGSSDGAAVVGIDPWKSTRDLWLEKTGKAQPDETIGAKAPVFFGNELEEMVLNMASKGHENMIGLGPLVRNQRRTVPEYRIAANIDAIVVDSQEPVEAKTSGNTSVWGEDGSGEIPDNYIIQCHMHMIAQKDKNPQRCHVPVLMAGQWGFDMNMHIVQRDNELIDIILKKCKEFWHCVENNIEPKDSRASLDTMKRCKRIPTKEVDVNPETVVKYLDACKQASFYEKSKKLLKEDILMCGHDAEAFNYGDTEKRLTFFEQSRVGFDEARFKFDNPELHAQYRKQTSYRVLRNSKRPKGI